MKKIITFFVIPFIFFIIIALFINNIYKKNEELKIYNKKINLIQKELTSLEDLLFKYINNYSREGFLNMVELKKSFIKGYIFKHLSLEMVCLNLNELDIENKYINVKITSSYKKDSCEVVYEKNNFFHGSEINSLVDFEQDEVIEMVFSDFLLIVEQKINELNLEYENI